MGKKILLSRRNFLKGGALVGATTALGALAACSQPASSSSESGSDVAGAAASGGPWSWSVPPAMITDDQIKETYDCDICIVGAGIAGIPAALYATEHGANTILLQKNSKMAVNGQSMGAWKHPYGDENGIEWDTDLTVQLYANVSNGKVNLKLVRNIIEHSGEALTYILSRVHDPAPNLGLTSKGTKGIEHVNCNWLPDGTFASRYEGLRTFFQNMVDLGISENVNYMFSTPAQQLATDSNGAVTGVIGKNTDGDYIKVNAAKGVVLCTGDVSDDEEMLEAYFPIMVGRPSLHGSLCDTGDGLKMGLWVGGAMDNAPSGLMLHFDPSPLSEVAPPYSAAPWLHVNINGERFTNENVGYQALASAVTVLPEYRAFQIIDSHYNEHISEYKNGGRGGTPEAMDAAVDAGSVLKADTIDDLASLAGFPTDTFKATVARYNELVDNGTDDDYGSAVIAFNGIKDPPFYAIQRMPAKLIAGLGLICDEYGQVINTDFQPIEGLYAAGNTMGSFFGYDYPVQDFGGISIGRAITSGILSTMAALGTHGEEIV